MYQRICTIVILAVFAVRGTGQEPQLASIVPAGGPRGGSADVAIDGKNLGEVRAVFFAHPGIVAEKGKGNRFTVRIAKDVPERDYDAWVLTAKGVSGPRRFAVGSLPEVVEKEPNDDNKTAQDLVVPCVVNGVFAAGTDRDLYRIAARSGQRLTFHFRSETLDGSARPALTLFGPSGKELLHNDGRDTEPVIEWNVAEDGSYVLRVEERAYQAGDNHVYRIAIFEGPRLTAAFPHVLTRGQSQSVMLYGYALPGGKAVGGDAPAGLVQIQTDIVAPKSGDADGGGWTSSSGVLLEGFDYRHANVYGGLRLALVDGPVTVSGGEAHGTLKHAQAVTTPTIVAGRFLKPRQQDWFRFPMKKNQMVWVEAVGERAGRTMDVQLALHDPKEKLVAAFSPYVLAKGEKPGPVPLKSADPFGLYKATEDGEHYLLVRDFFGTTRSGVERTYQVRIDKRREEVAVVATGNALVRGGASADVPLFALRRGGHEGAIRVRAEGLPAGLTVKEAVIPAKQTIANVTFTADKDAADWTGIVRLNAETEIDGKTQSLPVVAVATIRGGAEPQARRTSGIVAAVLGSKTP